MPTVGSWCELDVMCSAITADIQCTRPCVGFWPCTTPPTGIVAKCAAVAADTADEQVVGMAAAEAAADEGELPGIGVAGVETTWWWFWCDGPVELLFKL